MNIETTLRETLHSRSAGVPDRPGLLVAAEARASRLHRHRRVAGVGMAAAAVALVLAAPAALQGILDSTGGPGGAAQPECGGRSSPSPPPPGQPAQGQTGSESLVPATFEIPTFPFTPGWAPPGTKEPFAYTAGELRYLWHEYDVGRNVFSARVSPDDPATWPDEVSDDASEEQVTVRCLPGVLRWMGEVDDNRHIELTWQEQPDLWVTVSGGTPDELLRYAESLTEVPFPVRPPFTMDLVPRDAELRSVQPDAMWFVDRDEDVCAALERLSPSEAAEQAFRYERAGTPCETGEFIVRLFRGGPGADVPGNFLPSDGPISGDEPLPPRETIQVGDRQAELIGDHNLHVFLDGGLALGVTALGTLALSREDLVRLAEGVQVTPDALPSFE